MHCLLRGECGQCAPVTDACHEVGHVLCVLVGQWHGGAGDTSSTPGADASRLAMTVTPVSPEMIKFLIKVPTVKIFLNSDK